MLEHPPQSWSIAPRPAPKTASERAAGAAGAARTARPWWAPARLVGELLRRLAALEWPTLALIAATWGVWASATAYADSLGFAAWPVIVLAIVMHSSLCHETIHGHPTGRAALDEALVFPAIGLFVPYGRFRDTHLAHHRDARLTDPYDDPESNFLDPAVWARLPRWQRAIHLANNTLLGRMAIGPALGLAAFARGEIAALRSGNRAAARAVIAAWAWHLPALGLALGWLWLATPVSVPAYLAAAYAAMAILKIRTFLEHRAHETARGRSVIIEDRGPLALLFLNNNLHAVHHGHPGLAWYKLPRLYSSRRARFLDMNDGYVYRSYAEVFARHLVRRKDPVAHPLMPQRR